MIDGELKDRIYRAFHEAAEEQARATVEVYESLYASVPEGAGAEQVTSAIRTMTDGMVRGLEMQNKMYMDSLKGAFSNKDKLREAFGNAGKQ